MNARLGLTICLVFGLGCADAPSKAKSANNGNANNSNANNTNNANNANNVDPCDAHEEQAGTRCIPRSLLQVSFGATTDLPPSFANARACNWVISDIEAAANFEDRHEIIAETETCKVTRRLEDPNEFGTEAGPNDFGEMIISGPDVEASISEEIVGEFAGDFGGCRTAAEDLEFEYGTSYRVESAGGEDAPPFDLSARIPDAFDIECASPVPGEDFVVEWTPVGADEIVIDSDGVIPRDPIEIRCVVEDSGRFVIPAELTSLIETDEHTIDIRGRNRMVEVIDGVEISVDATSWRSCFGANR